MLVATDYEIFRSVPSSCHAVAALLPRHPLLVATLINEARFRERDGALIHGDTVLIEDEMHDWAWSKGKLHFFARAGDVSDILVIFATAERVFCPFCGKPCATDRACPDGHGVVPA